MIQPLNPIGFIFGNLPKALLGVPNVIISLILVILAEFLNRSNLVYLSGFEFGELGQFSKAFPRAARVFIGKNSDTAAWFWLSIMFFQIFLYGIGKKRYAI